MACAVCGSGPSGEDRLAKGWRCRNRTAKSRAASEERWKKSDTKRRTLGSGDLKDQRKRSIGS
eukprot:scaffold5503_cov142-Pinguiococcus_pyrenoidosus.AAC.1